MGVGVVRRPVWVGQVSRDIGVRMTTRAWNRRIPGFDRVAREDALDTVRFVIEDATWGCRGCAPTGG